MQECEIRLSLGSAFQMDAIFMGSSSGKRGCSCLQAWGLTQSSWACTDLSRQQTLSCSPDASWAVSASGTAFLGLWGTAHPSVSVSPSSAMGMNCSPEGKGSQLLCPVPPKGLHGVCGVPPVQLVPSTTAGGENVPPPAPRMAGRKLLYVWGVQHQAFKTRLW